MPYQSPVPRRTARLIVDGDVVRAYVPFSLKGIVKVLPERRWEPELRVWVLPVSYVNELADGLKAVGANVYVTRPDGTPWTGGGDWHGFRSTPAVGWADALLEAVGPDRHDAVYRALSKALHPDSGGGDTRLMQELNTAGDRARSIPQAERPW